MIVRPCVHQRNAPVNCIIFDLSGAELWDEESQQWLELPHGMDTWCKYATAVSVPAVALCKAPAAS
jgi:hypothetical protein